MKLKIIGTLSQQDLFYGLCFDKDLHNYLLIYIR
jgi:hypothetical protein